MAQATARGFATSHHRHDLIRLAPYGHGLFERHTLAVLSVHVGREGEAQELSQ